MKITNDNLHLVIEEASEVIQAATKILRFGIDDKNPDYYDGVPNTQVLVTEIGQLLHCIDRLGIPTIELEIAKADKWKNLKIYGPEGSYLKSKLAEHNDD